MDAQQRFREHIQQMLSGAGIELPPRLAKDIEEQIVNLGRQYSLAPESRRDEVYSRGEDKILRTLQTAQANKKRPAMTRITVLQDRVLVKPLEAKEEVRGGIIIPDTAKEKPQEAQVVAVGKGKLLQDGTRIEPGVQAGDRVLFGKYSGTEIKFDGDEYLILREDEIFGIIEASGQSHRVKGA